MVFVELGDIDDIEEREKYLEFLSQNDISFVKSSDGLSYTAQVTLVSEEDEEGDKEEEKVHDKFSVASSTYSYVNPSKKNSSSSSNSKFFSSDSSQGGSKDILGMHEPRPPRETKRILNAVKKVKSSILPDYSCYTNFCSLIENKQRLEPRERSLKWLLGIITDVYSDRARFLPQLSNRTWKHVWYQTLLNNSSSKGGVDDDDDDDRDDITGNYDSDGNMSKSKELLQIFPVFVMDHISKRYGLRKIVDQVCWDLVYNVHANRRENLVVEIFARFLEEYYDKQDLAFFLYTKKVVEGVIRNSAKPQFTKYQNDSNTSLKPRVANKLGYLKWGQIVSIAKIIYDTNSKEEHDNFLSLVDEHCLSHSNSSNTGESDSEQVVESNQLLHLALAQFHDTRIIENEVEPRKQKSESFSNSEKTPSTKVRDEDLEEVFETAEMNYREKLDKLGYAADVATSQLRNDFGYQQKLDEMCFAIKNALLNDDHTRDALSEVNEYTIREWAMALLGKEVVQQHDRENNNDSYSGEQQDDMQSKSVLSCDSASFVSATGASSSAMPLNHIEKPPITPLSVNEFLGYQGSRPDLNNNSTDGGNKQPIPTPPTSPRPPPPPPPLLSSSSPLLKQEDKKEKKLTPKNFRNMVASRSSTPVRTKREETSLIDTNPTQQVLREIQTCLARGKERYLESLMVAAQGLPPTVVHEIENEVRNQIDKKSRQILNDVIAGEKARPYMYENEDVPYSCSFTKLVNEFKDILKTCNESEGYYYQMSRQVEQCCNTLLNTTELRQEIEPLVALLVTYASARLGSRRKV